MDRIDGRGGDDDVSGSRAPSNFPLGNVADGVQPTASTPEQVAGGPGKDQVGGAGALDGGDGDDEITGDGMLTGGEGDDSLRGLGPGAVLDGGPGNDSVAEDAAASPASATFASGPIVLRGGPGDDAVGPGGSGDVPALLDGGDGNDTLWAGNIADRGHAGPGNGVARFRFRRTCGDLASIGAVRTCLVRVELRSANERLVGLGSVRLNGGGATSVRVPLRRSLSRGKVTIRLHLLGSDQDGRQEALNGGWSLA